MYFVLILYAIDFYTLRQLNSTPPIDLFFLNEFSITLTLRNCASHSFLHSETRVPGLIRQFTMLCCWPLSLSSLHGHLKNSACCRGRLEIEETLCSPAHSGVHSLLHFQEIS